MSPALMSVLANSAISCLRFNSTLWQWSSMSRIISSWNGTPWRRNHSSVIARYMIGRAVKMMMSSFDRAKRPRVYEKSKPLNE